MSEEDRLVPMRHARMALGVSQWTINKLITSGRLNIVHLGPRTRRIRTSDVVRLMKEGINDEHPN